MTTGQRIVLLLLLLSILAGTVTGSQLYYRLGYLWAVLFIGSWLWSRFSLQGLSLVRRPRSMRAQVGQVFEERFEIDNPGRLPRVWVSVRDDSTLPGTQGSRVFPIIEPHRGRSYLARTRLLERGVFPLGPTALESGDPFGLFPVSRLLPPEETLLVYPMMAELHKFPIPAGVMPGGDALRRRTPQVTPNAAGVREYAPGDPLNRIHWVSTARRGRLISKEFELDPLAEIWIFLDANRTGQASLPYVPAIGPSDDLWKRDLEISLPPSTEEYSVSTAATLARYYIRHGRTVGFASAGQSVTTIPPDRGGRQLSKILEALALIRAEGEMPLRALVEIHVQHLTRGSTVVLITHSASDEVALLADYLIRRGSRPVVVLIDTASFNGLAGTDELAEKVKFLNVPVRVVKRGADLELSLSGE